MSDPERLEHRMQFHAIGGSVASQMCGLPPAKKRKWRSVRTGSRRPLVEQRTHTCGRDSAALAADDASSRLASALAGSVGVQPATCPRDRHLDSITRLSANRKIPQLAEDFLERDETQTGQGAANGQGPIARQ